MRRIPDNEFSNDMEFMRDMLKPDGISKSVARRLKVMGKNNLFKDWQCKACKRFYSNLARKCRVCK